jgi:hypothetical protein
MVPTGAVYLARGSEGWKAAAERFLVSYRNHPAGTIHRCFVILKGFSSQAEWEDARRLFANAGFEIVERDDVGFDIGAYLGFAQAVTLEQLCFFNSHSEIIADYWLEKLVAYLGNESIGVVGATGSFESLFALGPEFPDFPNPHVRSNAFAIRRDDLLRIIGESPIATKIDAFRFESGAAGLTRRMLAAGYEVAVVGRNGRAYEPQWWPSSGTFRQGRQDNLLVADNVTRAYAQATWGEKHRLATLSWGPYLQEENQLSWRGRDERLT